MNNDDNDKGNGNADTANSTHTSQYFYTNDADDKSRTYSNKFMMFLCNLSAI